MYYKVEIAVQYADVRIEVGLDALHLLRKLLHIEVERHHTQELVLLCVERNAVATHDAAVGLYEGVSPDGTSSALGFGIPVSLVVHVPVCQVHPCLFAALEILYHIGCKPLGISGIEVWLEADGYALYVYVRVEEVAADAIGCLGRHSVLLVQKGNQVSSGNLYSLQFGVYEEDGLVQFEVGLLVGVFHHYPAGILRSGGAGTHEHGSYAEGYPEAYLRSKGVVDVKLAPFYHRSFLLKKHYKFKSFCRLKRSIRGKDKLIIDNFTYFSSWSFWNG